MIFFTIYLSEHYKKALMQYRGFFYCTNLGIKKQNIIELTHRELRA